MLFLSTLFSFANPLPEPIEYKKHDYENELKNNFFRVTSYDEMYNVTLEKVMYRGLIIDNRISDIVKFDIDEYSSVADYHELEIIDHCAHPGTYFYISDLDCTEFINEFNSLQCRNYAVIVHEIPFYENSCDQSRYTSIDLSEHEIELMKTEMSAGRAWFSVDIEEIDFGYVEIGRSAEKEILITNRSESFKGYPRDKVNIDPWSDGFEITEYPQLLNPGEKGSFKIKFEPLENMEYISSLYIDNSSEPVILKGTGGISENIDEDNDEYNSSTDSNNEKDSGGCNITVF